MARTMSKLSGWKSRLEIIERYQHDLLTKNAIYKLPAEDELNVKATIAQTREPLTTLVATADNEDDERQLFSLDKASRGEQVKWPVFSGESGEDFFKFKRDFIDAATQNRTSTKNQISKLRENLKGNAKSLVPDSIMDIERGLAIL